MVQQMPLVNIPVFLG